ncbi:O-antigen ligase [Haloferula luteola]|uniref:O-antigen ligase n=1 Tax=Haloferula luteola TaxID=595692 RepID=A0A840UYK0_9BACT|nr:O-antigen ligase family protein [Haloferula luteola]MBB5350815.1 O-antigen ligase [Haloferula luteola]
MKMLVVAILATLAMAVLWGPQTVAWSWGPALVTLSLGVLGACGVRPAWRYSPILGGLVAAAVLWLGWVAVRSPVREEALQDGLLVVGMLGMAWLGSRLDPRRSAFRALPVGLSFLVLANGVVALVQWMRPEFAWPYGARPYPNPSGFFGHYNYFSNFLVGAAFFCAPRIFFSDDRRWEKVLYAVAVISTIVLVPLSGSRGGLLGLIAACFLFFLGTGLMAWRRKQRGVVVAAIVSPVLGLIVLLLAWASLRGTEGGQMTSSNLNQTFKNNDRLSWYEVAMAVIKEHPLEGGGSRAFAWERNQHWSLKGIGVALENEPFVHNEALQLTADYGWLGFGLVGGALAVLVCFRMVGLVLGEEGEGVEETYGAVGLGVLSALGGMLVQSNFSFVFHLLPSVLLLGLWLGLGGLRGLRPEKGSAIRLLPGRLVSVAGGLGLLYFGVLGSLALAALWPALYAKPPWISESPRKGFERMDEAMEWWPSWRLLQMKGVALRKLASDETATSEQRWADYRAAEATFEKATQLHPKNAALFLDQANALSVLQKNDEAEQSFEQGVKLTGRLETVFQSRFYYAHHLYEAAVRDWNSRQPERARARLEAAKDLLEEAQVLGPRWALHKDLPGLEKQIGELDGFLESAAIAPSGWSRPVPVDGD